MEIKTRYRKLSIAAFVATICLLLWLLSFAGGSAQMAVGAGGPLLPTAGFEVAQRVSPTLWPDATASHEHEDKSLDRKGELVGDAVLLIATLVPWPDPDGYESDDAQYEANRITVNDPLQRHNFHAAGDEDWVKFWAWAGNTYTITTSDLDFGCDTVLELYDAESHKLREDDDGGEEPRASKIDDWTPSENGTYYVRVSQYDPIGENLWYSLGITDSVTCKDKYEPDDTCDDAKKIAVGTSQAHNFHGPCGDDEDWVWFEAVGGNVYTIWTFNLEGSNDTTLCLCDKDCNPLDVCNDDDPDNIPGSRIVWEAPADGTGTYYVKVSPFEPSAGKSCAGECDVSYFLSVATLISTTPTPTPTPTGDSHEPDDAKHEAERIPVNGISQDHTFHVEDDEDWVKFWAWADNDYTIRTFNLGGGNDTTLKLYDAESHQLREDDDGGEELGASRIDWLAPENGTYFVRVARPKVGGSGYHGLSSSDDLTYSLEVRETIPCRDEYELNSDDDCEEAEWITVGGSSQVHNFHVPCFNSYHSPDTADWVKFEAAKGFTYTIKTSHLEGGNDTVLGLYDANCIMVTVNGNEVVNDDYPDDIPASRIVWEAPNDGTYYVKVSPFDHRAGGCGVSYTLEVAPSIASLDLTVSPDEVPADGVESSTLTACVEDREGKLVEDVTVCFTTTLGELSDECKRTGPDGCASVTLTSTESGTAEVTACVGPICDPDTVTFNPPSISIYLPLVLKPPPTPTPTPTPTPPPCLPTPTAPTCDWCEPNNDWENRDRCGPLCSGISYEACLCCVNDPTDYYYIDITTRNRITIALDVPSGVDYDLYLYNSPGEMVAQSDKYGKGVDESIGYDPPATGRYYIRIYPYEGCSDSDPYILTATYE
ncbi:MAG: pre-peptidase C-terminal domain-containing protein [Chloroflexi bacterium]|nr:pre-peptidase C-terminal domain-containing protein [Chloroflexota bacterium]